MRSLVPLFAMVAALSACNGVETIPAGSASPTPEVGDDDDDDGVTPTPEATPLPPPALGGVFNMGRVRTHDQDGIGVMGMFMPTPFSSTGSNFEALWSYYPQIATDTCATVTSQAVGGGDMGQDGGELRLTGPGGTAEFWRLPLAGMVVYAYTGAASLYAPNASYTLEGTGAGPLGAFSQEMQSPGDIVVTSPAITAEPTFTISTGQDLPLQWTSVSDGLPVIVSVEQHIQGNPDDGPGFDRVLVCKFADDGEGTIPASQLQPFLPGNGQEEPVEDGLRILRYRWHTFQPPGALAPSLVIFESITAADLHFSW